ncbi:PREDICTED: lipoma-preferred partner homolog [Tinamus guttatus]|uniref:lipoma-preferred partner homolog n=1 Tax=Tinamus guttatus TaxID=94827 RepID=UPI00052E6B0E|nr:PREDICTED: lipoma-preferred partner homolog [Tinamus guttatus]
MPAPPGAFPPPPPLDDVSFNVQVNPGGKTLEERRSSLDAEIDSLTSILADLESSSPYKPRTQQVSGALHQQRAGSGPKAAAGVNL